MKAEEMTRLKRMVGVIALLHSLRGFEFPWAWGPPIDMKMG
jgi:hypothetical protein